MMLSIRNKIIILADCINKTSWKGMCLAILITLAIAFNHIDALLNLQIRHLRCKWVLNSADNTTNNQMRLLQKYQEMKLQLETLTKQHADLIGKVRNSPRLINKLDIISLSPLYPGPLLNGHYDQDAIENYEIIRRRIYFITKELWYYVHDTLLSVAYHKLMPGEKRIIQDELDERNSWLLSWQQRLESSDGYEEWRRKEAASVSDLVQRRLSYLQNPPDCRTAKKLTCNMDSCGFGCQIHHIAYCLVTAYATERTLVLLSRGWQYNKKGWESIFHPLSDNCNRSMIKGTLKEYSKGITDANVVHLRALRNFMKNRRQFYYLPYHVPSDLAKRIGRFNSDPSSWWIGQMIKYILRPRKHIQKAINETIHKLRPRSAVVGVHVRRTDKLHGEAEFHDIDEYMSHVADYYAQLQLTRNFDERRVYLATDEPRVLERAKRKYKQYSFFSNNSVAKSASVKTRFSPNSLTSLLIDLLTLSLCDYVVCTFSSNVCRLVYEIMQTNMVDASNNVYSLDSVYYFTTAQPYYRTAVKRNKGRINSINFDIGNQIKMQYWNFTTNEGTVIGRNNVFQFGPVPLYKTQRYIQLRQFPEYQQVPIFSTTLDYQLLDT